MDHCNIYTKSESVAIPHKSYQIQKYDYDKVTPRSHILLIYVANKSMKDTIEE